MMLFVNFCVAQNRTITGTVISAEDNKPIPGATVSLKGTKGGTQTDAAGRFSIPVPSGVTSVDVSFLGFITQNVVLGNSTVLNVVLETDSRSLSEVIVTSFGIVR